MIDIIAFILCLLAIFKGLQRGLIAAIFAVIGLLLAFVLSFKFSAVVATWLGNEVSLHQRWLPFIAFLLVFIGTILLFRLLAAAIEKGFELAMLGWVNKIAGVAIYLLVYGLFYSAVLYYLTKMQLLSDASVSNSVVYPYLQSWAPTSIAFLSNIMPFLKDVFTQLQQFFEKSAETSLSTGLNPV